jgi:hypothetical protein
MAENQEPQDYSEFLSSIGVKIRDIEEKENILKDRVLLIGENLISQKNDLDQELIEIKAKLLELESEIKRARLTMQGIVEGSDNFVRRNEFEILKRQFEMFQPLNLARISDVERIVNKTFKNNLNK